MISGCFYCWLMTGVSLNYRRVMFASINSQGRAIVFQSLAVLLQGIHFSYWPQVFEQLCDHDIFQLFF